MARPAPTARSSALRILNSVLGEGRLMSEVLGTGLLDPLSAPDRARAQRLANDTLRGMERADRLLNRHLRKQPPLSVRNVLRLATVEICMGGDAHGVVNEAVALVGQDKRTFAMKGLVNAILRKVADTGHEQWELLRAPRLPKWLRVPLVEAYGPERVAAIETVQFGTPPFGHHTKRRRTDRSLGAGTWRSDRLGRQYSYDQCGTGFGAAWVCRWIMVGTGCGGGAARAIVG